MKRFNLILLLILILALPLKATHNRAGEITYRQISGYTYEFTITTFTYTLSSIDRTELNVNWGHNASSPVSRTYLDETLPDYYRKNTYITQHTFPGPGIYEVVMQDPTRNQGVANIPNSVFIVFSVKTILMVSPELEINNSPVLLNYPIDKAAVGQKFIHNPAAYDADGDSLSFTIGTCSRENGIPIENYTLPKASNSIYINPVTGDLVWDAPTAVGIFNIAINIEEWRHGLKIGNITRDMQIEVFNTNNKPPVNNNIKNICVEAGKKIHVSISATDPDNDLIKQTATGGIFSLPSSVCSFNVDTSRPGYVSSTLEWQTQCKDVRKQPYFIVIKSEDNNPSVKLVDIDNFYIKVLGPAPKNVIATSINNSIIVNWEKSICTNATGYEIYRKQSPSPTIIDSCTGGLPISSGFTKIKTVNGIANTTFLDDNSGIGLNRGINYCYRIVAIYADGAQSYPSDEACASLTAGIPALTSASVEKIDPISGIVFLSWIKPNLDSIPAPGPYEYVISRNSSFSDTTFTEIFKRASIDLNDTTYTDTALNTVVYPYNYKVELYNNTPLNRFLIGDYETASTLVPGFTPGDNRLIIQFLKSVPWFNTRYIIFRKNPSTMLFDSIGFTDTEQYTDYNLANNVSYTYKVLSYGYRELDGLYYSTVNWSHENSGTPIDKEAPCPPKLSLTSNCDSSLNRLVWTNPNNTCANDVVKYFIYYKMNPNDSFSLLDSVINVLDTTYVHYPADNISACYAVTAIDSFNNESAPVNIQCFIGCSGYSLPNVFSPNNDNINDYYISNNPNGYVKWVDMKIFNRWGNLVFETNDPDINWDGKDKNSKKTVSTGVYYYVCDVYEPRLNGTRVLPLTGFIHAFGTDYLKKIVE